MTDPLSQIMGLMRPRAVFAKGISGAGAWAVRYSHFGQPSFCMVTEGRCRLQVAGEPPLDLHAGDFVLLPATPGFTLSGLEPAIPVQVDSHQASLATAREVRHGRQDGPEDVRLLGGYFLFGSPDAGLLVSLLPSTVHIRGADRLETLVRLLGDEARADRAGRDLVQARLVELLLIEALRSAPADQAPTGLIRGLADERTAAAIRAMHADPARAWTVVKLAEAARLSRSAFFERFVRTVGSPPMEYLLGWRMALAKDLLARPAANLEDVAQQVGYGSASTFSTAFRRHVGQPPRRYARHGQVAAQPGQLAPA